MESTPVSEETRNTDEMFKILLATDIHLGFAYNKRRGQETNDTFATFEEILQYGQQHEVDFILLGGDLFHDTKPTQTVLLKCIELLRKYCLGPRQIKIEFLTDPELVFDHCPFKGVNYEDPNLNVSMPVFSIHGNHDDPSFGNVGTMDILSASGLVNYFGKWTDLNKLTVPPLILKKGENRLALYGLSYINDQRFARLFRDFKVELLRSEEVPDCFNVAILHQNRAYHEEYAYIPENSLPKFINLVLWGHEHECRIQPEFVTDKEYFITQPGSSVATSLCEGESKSKHVGVLYIKKLEFKIKKLKLKTVRPFVFDNLILRDLDLEGQSSMSLSEAVYKFVDDHIENVLIPKAAEQITGHPDQPIKPLLRIRIFYSTSDEMFDTFRLAQKYYDEVANPQDMILFRKEKHFGDKSNTDLDNGVENYDELAEIFQHNDDDINWSRSVEGGIKKFFQKEENKDKLTVLTVDGLNEALKRFVDMGDTDAFTDITKHQAEKTMTHLETCDTETPEDIIQEIKRFRDYRLEKQNEERDEILRVLNNTNRKAKKAVERPVDVEIYSDSDDGGQSDLPSKGRGSRGGRGSRSRARGTRGSRGRAKAAETSTLNVTKTASSRIAASQQKIRQQSTLHGFTSVASSQSKALDNIVDLLDSDSA